MPAGIANGEELDGALISERTRERFWAKVRKGRGCWRWTAGHSNEYGGFGFMDLSGKKWILNSQRVMWAIVYGHTPAGVAVARHDDICRHKDCVRPDHHYLGTPSEILGSLRCSRGMCPSKLESIRQHFEDGKTDAQVMAWFNLSKSQAQDIRINRTFTDPEYAPIHYRGTRHRDAKLDPDKIHYARRQLARGRSQCSIAKELEVAFSTLHDAVSGKTWKSVDPVEQLTN